MNKGFTVWLTGLPGSGKTTIAHLLEIKLKEYGRNAEVLDDDGVRENLFPRAGAGKEDHNVNIKRIAFVCKLLTRNGVAVISAAESPCREARNNARKETGNFVEVFVKCSVETCAERDVHGLYKKALKGEIQGFAGVSGAYEEPLNPELTIETDKDAVEVSVNKIVTKLIESGYLKAKDSAANVYSSDEETKIMERLSRLGYL